MKKITFLLLLHFFFTNSFSQITNWKLRMEPDSARVMVGNQLFLRTFMYGTYDGHQAQTLNRAGETFEIHGLMDVNGHLKKPEWTVNGILNGNNLVGRIILIDSVGLKFIAPINKPDKNPVEVIATYKDVYLNGKVFNTTLTCRIWVVDEEWTLRIEPDSARILLWSQLPLRILRDSSGYTFDASELYGRDGTLKRPEWTVNGIANGNYSVGNIILGKRYHSSSDLPDKNPVEITVTYKDVYLNGYFADRKITGHIWVEEGQWTIRLNPNSARLRVNDTLPLRVCEQYNNLKPVVVNNQQLFCDYENEGWFYRSKTPKPPEWTVNGIVNGNNQVGQIIMNMNPPYNLTFKAPAHKPDKNPVEVIAAYKDVHLNDRIFDTTITCHIEIVERDDINNKEKDKKDNDLKSPHKKDVDGSSRFEVKMVAKIISGSKKMWGGIVTYIDEGSFIVSVEKNKPDSLLVEKNKVTVINITNNLEVMTSNCTKIILNPTTNTGIIHVAGTKHIKITPANPPGQPYPVVEIEFMPYPTELTRFEFTCPPPPGYTKGSSKGKIGLETGAPPPLLMFMGMPAFPQHIKFIAKDEEQVIQQWGKEDEELFFKIWVKKLKDN